MITAVEEASKAHSQGINEVECSVYECSWCAMNYAAEYTDDYNVVSIGCNWKRYDNMSLV